MVAAEAGGFAVGEVVPATVATAGVAKDVGATVPATAGVKAGGTLGLLASCPVTVSCLVVFVIVAEFV